MLIGLSASKCGTQDQYITRSLTLHIPSLILGTDLEMPATVSAAALVGTGLLYQGSAHGFMTEVLLSEMARIPVDDMNQRDMNAREGYSLAAGIGIGLINLARGTKTSPPPGLHDLKIDERLIRYMTGGIRPENDPMLVARKIMTSQNVSQPKNNRDKPITYSAKIQESEKLVNVDVTGPGACLALMLMYLKSHNETIASRVAIPSTKYLLDYVRPDMILLRVIGYNMIMWNTIDATESWIERQIPETILRDMDDHLRAVYANIIAACCMTLGFRYAGSQSDRVIKLIRKYMVMFEHGKIKQVQLSRMVADHALLMTILAQSCVISGSGDIEMVRIIKRTRKRFMAGAEQEDKSYGYHMCLSMALGLTFLGGGRCSLNTTNSSIAYLITSLFPRFPMSTNDNRYHLQALRHLYTLAAEPRLLETRDVDTHETCYVPIEIISEQEKSSRRAPCLLPEKIESIRVQDERYCPIEWKGSLPSMILHVKKRAGYLSYAMDPKGTRSIVNYKQRNEMVNVFGLDNIKALSRAFDDDKQVSRVFRLLMISR
jgi:anaphase-promoting complex subunit 1